MKSLQSKDNLVWLDLEMTGLDPEKERIIEIATLITDSQLNILAEGPKFDNNPTKLIARPNGRMESEPAWIIRFDRCCKEKLYY